MGYTWTDVVEDQIRDFLHARGEERDDEWVTALAQHIRNAFL